MSGMFGASRKSASARVVAAAAAPPAKKTEEVYHAVYPFDYEAGGKSYETMGYVIPKGTPHVYYRNNKHNNIAMFPVMHFPEGDPSRKAVPAVQEADTFWGITDIRTKPLAGEGSIAGFALRDIKKGALIGVASGQIVYVTDMSKFESGLYVPIYSKDDIRGNPGYMCFKREEICAEQLARLFDEKSGNMAPCVYLNSSKTPNVVLKRYRPQPRGTDTQIPAEAVVVGPGKEQNVYEAYLATICAYAIRDIPAGEQLTIGLDKFTNIPDERYVEPMNFTRLHECEVIVAIANIEGAAGATKTQILVKKSAEKIEDDLEVLPAPAIDVEEDNDDDGLDIMPLGSSAQSCFNFKNIVIKKEPRPDVVEPAPPRRAPKRRIVNDDEDDADLQRAILLSRQTMEAAEADAQLGQPVSKTVVAVATLKRQVEDCRAKLDEAVTARNELVDIIGKTKSDKIKASLQDELNEWNAKIATFQNDYKKADGELQKAMGPSSLKEKPTAAAAAAPARSKAGAAAAKGDDNDDDIPADHPGNRVPARPADHPGNRAARPRGRTTPSRPSGLRSSFM